MIKKFKAWHIKKRKMFSAEEMARDQLTLLPTGKFINVHSGDTRRSTILGNDVMTPLQYTGIKDKNGVEIYEGDILKVYYLDYKEEPDIAKVAWFDCYYPAFDIYTHSENSGTGFQTYCEDCNAFSHPEITYEVIGNIYEDLELLDQNYDR